MLPFVDLSEKHDEEYFANGLSEELMGMLSKVSELKVPVRTSSFYFKGKQVTIADIAKSLGVAHALEGSGRSIWIRRTHRRGSGSPMLLFMTTQCPVGRIRMFTRAPVRRPKRRSDWIRSYRMLELDPNNVLGLWIAANYAMIGDRLDEALQLIQAASALDAVGWGISMATGDVQFRRGRLPEVEPAYRKAIELSPTSARTHLWLGVVLLARGEPAAALAAMEQETDEGLRLYGVALAFGALGRQSDADRALAALETKYADGMAVLIASVYADRKQLDRAFTWLDRAFRQHDGQWPGIKSLPGIENLAPDPRYKALLQKANLPE